jgi:hypothetical protein
MKKQRIFILSLAVVFLIASISLLPRPTEAFGTDNLSIGDTGTVYWNDMSNVSWADNIHQCDATSDGEVMTIYDDDGASTNWAQVYENLADFDSENYPMMEFKIDLVNGCNWQLLIGLGNGSNKYAYRTNVSTGVFRMNISDFADGQDITKFWFGAEAFDNIGETVVVDYIIFYNGGHWEPDGSGYHFNDDGYARKGSFRPLSGLTTMSMVVWVKFLDDVTPASKVFAGQYQSWTYNMHLYKGTNGKVYWMWGNASVNTYTFVDEVVELDEWYCIIVAYNGSHLIMNMNGTEAVSDNTSGAVPTIASDFTLGSRDASNLPSNTIIAYTGLWKNYVLTDNEQALILEYGMDYAPMLETGDAPDHSWNFEEGSGTTLEDGSEIWWEIDYEDLDINGKNSTWHWLDWEHFRFFGFVWFPLWNVDTWFFFGLGGGFMAVFGACLFAWKMKEDDFDEKLRWALLSAVIFMIGFSLWIGMWMP